MTEFLKQQQAGAAAGAAAANANPAQARNEIVVDGISFRVLDGGKKLARVAGESREYPSPTQPSTVSHLVGSDPTATTPKSTVIAGVKFHRTKTGNLVVNRVVRDHRYVSSHGVLPNLTRPSRSGVIKKISEPCKIFSTTGIFFSSLFPLLLDFILLSSAAHSAARKKQKEIGPLGALKFH